MERMIRRLNGEQFHETMNRFHPFAHNQAIITLIHAQHYFVAFEKQKKCYLFYLSSYLLVESFHKSAPFSVLELDAFSMLISLFSTVGSLLSKDETLDENELNINETAKYSAAANKSILELMLTFHLVQVFCFYLKINLTATKTNIFFV